MYASHYWYYYRYSHCRAIRRPHYASQLTLTLRVIMQLGHARWYSLAAICHCHWLASISFGIDASWYWYIGQLRLLIWVFIITPYTLHTFAINSFHIIDYTADTFSYYWWLLTLAEAIDITDTLIATIDIDRLILTLHYTYLYNACHQEIIRALRPLDITPLH